MRGRKCKLNQYLPPRKEIRSTGERDSLNRYIVAAAFVSQRGLSNQKRYPQRIQARTLPVLPYLHCWIAEEDPGAPDIEVVGGSFTLAAGIADRDRWAAVQQLKHAVAHLMLRVGDGQT